MFLLLVSVDVWRFVALVDLTIYPPYTWFVTARHTGGSRNYGPTKLAEIVNVPTTAVHHLQHPLVCPHHFPLSCPSADGVARPLHVGLLVLVIRAPHLAQLPD